MSELTNKERLEIELNKARERLEQDEFYVHWLEGVIKLEEIKELNKDATHKNCEQVGELVYSCGHKSSPIILDCNELSYLAYEEWRNSVGWSGDKSKCWECWNKKEQKGCGKKITIMNCPNWVCGEDGLLCDKCKNCEQEIAETYEDNKGNVIVKYDSQTVSKEKEVTTPKKVVPSTVNSFIHESADTIQPKPKARRKNENSTRLNR